MRTVVVLMLAVLCGVPAWPALAQLASTSSGQAYPVRPIRLIIAVPPGGAADFTARIVGQKLAEAMGQNVVGENRGGAGGTIASDIAAKANPDGHTLLWSSSTTHGVGPVLYAKLPYDALRDFTHVGLATSLPMFVVAHHEGRMGEMGTGGQGDRSAGRLTRASFDLRSGQLAEWIAVPAN